MEAVTSRTTVMTDMGSAGIVSADGDEKDGDADPSGLVPIVSAYPSEETGCLGNFFICSIPITD